MKWLLLQTKLLLLKSSIRKDAIAVSVNKESMNKVTLKMYFSGFSFLFTTPFSGCLQRRIWNVVEYLQQSFFCENT